MPPCCYRIIRRGRGLKLRHPERAFEVDFLPFPLYSVATAAEWYGCDSIVLIEEFVWFLMSLSCGTSEASHNDSAIPSAPARAVRPMRWT